MEWNCQRGREPKILALLFQFTTYRLLCLLPSAVVAKATAVQHINLQLSYSPIQKKKKKSKSGANVPWFNASKELKLRCVNPKYHEAVCMLITPDLKVSKLIV